VRKIMDPSANAQNAILLDLKISDAKALQNLTVEFVDKKDIAKNNLQTFLIKTENGNTILSFENYAIPVSDGQVQLYLSVRDQLMDPYVKVVVRGIDNNGNPSNELLYDIKY
jgi:hypothetical protein